VFPQPRNRAILVKDSARRPLGSDGSARQTSGRTDGKARSCLAAGMDQLYERYAIASNLFTRAVHF
jgi:hypothetical protein